MKLSEHPLWLVGFRPFFALACLAGIILPLVWVMILSGQLAPPQTPFSPIQWHAHEMFFGFGWAVLGGFMLTATKNWVGIRGTHGSLLMLFALFWLVERAGMWFAGSLPPVVFAVTNNLFLATIIVMLLWTLLRHRADDSYRSENWAFLVVLPTFLVAKQLLLGDYFAAGSSLATGLFRVAFLVMLERTLTQFMKNAFQVAILRNAWLDNAIRLLALIFVFESFLPRPLAAATALLLALLLLFRLAFWKPLLALRRLDLGIMVLGCAGIIAQLLIEFGNHVAPVAWVGTVSVSVFTFGVMGLIIPAMLIRICNGHTGRKVVFAPLDKLVLWIMIAGFIARIVLPQFFPAAYPRWIDVSAAAWFAAFALLAWRYIPFLLAARIDGKEH